VRAFSEAGRREVDIRDHKAPISTHAGSKADWQKAIHICQPASFGFRVPAYARNSNRRHRLASSCPTPVAPASAQAPVGCGPMPPTPPGKSSHPSDRACRILQGTTRKPEPTVRALRLPCPGRARGERGSWRRGVPRTLLVAGVRL
jgi:hypothetical protein